MTLSRDFKGTGLLSTGQVAEEMGVHRSTVWLWIRAGTLPSKKVGSFIGVTRRDLAKFMTIYHVDRKEKKA